MNCELIDDFYPEIILCISVWNKGKGRLAPNQMVQIIFW